MRIALAAVDELFHLLPAALPEAAGQIKLGQLEAIFGIGLRPAGCHQTFRKCKHLGAMGLAGIGEEEAELESFVLGGGQRRGQIAIDELDCLLEFGIAF